MGKTEIVEADVQKWFMGVVNEFGYQVHRRNKDDKILNALYSHPSIAELHT